MWSFWQIVTSNAVVVLLLAIGVGLVSRLWKNAAALHLLWLIVLLKLFAPPLVITRLPVSFPFLQGTVRDEALDRHAPSTAGQREHLSSAPVADPISGNRLVTSPPADERGPQILERWRRFVAHTDWPLWNVSVVVGAIWLLGAFCVGAAYAIRIRRFARYVAHFEPPSAAIEKMVAELSQRLGLARVPDVLMTSRTLPPLVWSIARAPRVILPSRLFARLSGEAQAAILAHELVHVRRRDYLVRLLELAATTLFWWHPVVRWATWQLRELEEQCCDARVLQLFPQQPRTYAAALVDTLEFLSEQPRTAVPLPTAIQSGGSLSRRIRMLTENRRNRLSGLSAALVVGLVSLPFVVGFAADPAQSNRGDGKEQKAEGGSTALLEGRVTNEAGAPLADARVRVAIPAARMRFLVSPADHRLLETKTDAKGDFRLELSGITKPTKISIDAQLAGYRRLSGTLMRGGDPNEYQIAPGRTVHAAVTLKPALYFAGMVVDEKGKPIPGVDISANANSSRASGGVERTTSNPDGSFELFNYSPKRFDLGDASCRGVVSFFHPDYVESEIDDVYTIPNQDRRTLRIVLPTGHSVAGTIVDDAGNPVPRAMVKAVRNDGVDRKAMLTDAKGQFTLRGLAEGPTTLTVRAFDLKQKIQQPLLVDKDQNDLVVRLQKMLVPPHVKRYTVLGLELTDITPKLKAAYDLPDWRGALILDAGKDSDRLDIGHLAEGYDFWMVGEKQIANVREFVERILAEAATQQTKQTYSIRVVYRFSTVDFDGTNTQYLKLTPEDIKQLQVVLAQLTNDAKLRD